MQVTGCLACIVQHGKQGNRIAVKSPRCWFLDAEQDATRGGKELVLWLAVSTSCLLSENATPCCCRQLPPHDAACPEHTTPEP